MPGEGVGTALSGPLWPSLTAPPRGAYGTPPHPPFRVLPNPPPNARGGSIASFSSIRSFQNRCPPARVGAESSQNAGFQAVTNRARQTDTRTFLVAAVNVAGLIFGNPSALRGTLDPLCANLLRCRAPCAWVLEPEDPNGGATQMFATSPTRPCGWRWASWTARSEGVVADGMVIQKPQPHPKRELPCEA